PAVVDMVLAAALGGLGDRLLRLALGADQQHSTAARDDVADRLQPLVQHRLGLFEIDDVDSVAHAEDGGRRLGVPAPGMVAEMDAGLEQLAHAGSGNWHLSVLFRLGRRRENRCSGRIGDTNTGAAVPGWQQPRPCVRYREVTYGARALKTSPAG